MEVLSNWLAHQTVNLVSSERVGSSPTTSTKYHGLMIIIPDCLSGVVLNFTELVLKL